VKQSSQCIHSSKVKPFCFTSLNATLNSHSMSSKRCQLLLNQKHTIMITLFNWPISQSYRYYVTYLPKSTRPFVMRMYLSLTHLPCCKCTNTCLSNSNEEVVCMLVDRTERLQENVTIRCLSTKCTIVTRHQCCVNIQNFALNRIVSYYSVWSETNPAIQNFQILI